MKTYPSNLTDSHRGTILEIIKDKRKRKYTLREIELVHETLRDITSLNY